MLFLRFQVLADVHTLVKWSSISNHTDPSLTTAYLKGKYRFCTALGSGTSTQVPRGAFIAIRVEPCNQWGSCWHAFIITAKWNKHQARNFLTWKWGILQISSFERYNHLKRNTQRLSWNDYSNIKHCLRTLRGDNLTFFCPYLLWGHAFSLALPCRTSNYCQRRVRIRNFYSFCRKNLLYFLIQPVILIIWWLNLLL